MPRIISQTAGLLSILLAFASPAEAGPQCVEGTGDAGSLRPAARVCSGAGTLTSITGQTAPSRSAPDFEDMFLIRITDPVNFTARTDGSGSATFDTQLWLFRLDETNKQGAFGLLANDEIQGGPAGRSRLQPPATDGTGQAIPGPGLYLLAVTGFDNDPRSGGGAPIFNQAVRTEVSGPDGAGGAGIHNSWSGGGATGTYNIHLVGAAFVPPIPATSPAGAVVLGLLVVAAAIAAFRRHSAVTA